MICVYSAEHPCPSFPFFLSLGPRIKLCLEGNFPSSTKWPVSSQQSGSRFKRRKRPFLANSFCEETGFVNCVDVSGKLGEACKKITVYDPVKSVLSLI